MEWRNSKGFIVTLLLLGTLGVHPNGEAQTNKPGTASDAGLVPAVTVYKTPICGCCTQWVEHLEHSGLDVSVITVEETDSVRARLGVPDSLASCHTAVAGDYWVEGHVPADLIQTLLREQPNEIKGIAVPGMPAGAPGMEVDNPATYRVYSVDEAGEARVYATREGRDAN